MKIRFLLVPGLLAAAGVLIVQMHPLEIAPGTAAWGRLVFGASPDGTIPERAVVSLPGLDRGLSSELFLEIEVSSAARPILGISIDQEQVRWVRASRSGIVVQAVPKRRAPPGLRLRLLRSEGSPPPRLLSVSVRRRDPLPLGSALLGLIFCSGLTLVLMKRIGPMSAAATTLVAAGLWILMSTPALLLMMLPDPSALARFSLPFVLFGLSAAAIVYRAGSAERRFYWQAVALLAAFLLGTWVRIYFLPSAGSWDTEYWKAWMMRASSHGVSRVYGDADSVPEGHFLAQLRGEEPAWTLQSRAREFGVDYPPLAMFLWRWSWWAVGTAGSGLANDEAQNVAAKLPAVLGDVGAVLFLLWAFKSRPSRAAALAALYWCCPLSWLSSAVLGFQDGAYAPMAACAVVAAGRGRAGIAGLFLTVACLIKPLGLIVAPVVAAALVVRRVPLRAWGRALSMSLAVTLLVVLPFYLEGTMAPLMVHIYRAFAPGNLSSGYANPWWIVGQIIAVMRQQTSGFAARVEFVRLDAVDFPARFLGTLLLALTAATILWRYLRSSVAGAAAWAASSIFFAYSILAVGVYENHPHLLFLLLIASGLFSVRLQLVAGAASAAYVLNLLALSGLGRFYGPRYMALAPVAEWISGIRMGLGFDLTLILAVVNSLSFVLLFGCLGRELTGRATTGE